MQEPAAQPPLVATKWFVPRLRPGRVERARLRERLEQSRHTVVVSAPAGSGKSVLLADWAATCGERVAWLSLEPGDDDPSRFTNYLLAALRNAAITTWSEHLDGAPGEETIDATLTEMLNEVAAGGNRANLILDDYHVIESQAVHRLMQFVIDHLPPNLRLVIATRSDPPLALSRLRARGELTEIRDADLRFSAGEASAFLNQTMAVHLTGREIEELERRTEGWAAGLQMAALSLQATRDTGQFVSRFTGSNRYVLDYLTDEIVAVQRDDVREFLIETSLLDRLNAPLCDAVTGRHDSQSVLQALETSNLFLISLDDVRYWYRYHHLFSAVLQHHLERTRDAGSIALLHQRASDWYARNGSPDAAIRHALAANDPDRVLSIVKAHAPGLMQEGDSTTVTRWLRALPGQDRWDDVDLLLLQGSVAVQEFDVDAAERCVARCEEMTTDETPAATRAAVLALRAILLRTLLRPKEALSMCERAYAIAQPHTFWHDVIGFEMATNAFLDGDLARAGVLASSRRDGVPPRSLAVAMSHAVGARARLLRGDPQEAVALAKEAIAWIEEWDRGDHRGQALASFPHAVLADVHRLWNDLPAARALAERGLLLGRRGFPIGVLESMLALMQVAAAEAQWSEVERLQEELLRVIRNSRWEFFAEAVEWAGHAATLRRAHRTGAPADIDPVAEAVARAGLDRAPFRVRERQLAGLFTFDAPLIAARTMMAGGRTALAVELLAVVIDFNRQRGCVLLLIEALILRAIALGSAETMQEALELASRPRLVRPFVDEAEAARALLERAVPRIRNRDFGSMILSAVNLTSADVEVLSARELEVLRLVAAGASNQAAGEKLFISARTVKKHLENIYGKLSVSGRTQAVARARELRLL